MALHELHVDWLRTRDPRAALALAAALRPTRPLEAHLLDRFARHGAGCMAVDEGGWRGHRAWIGPQLPQTTLAGQLWLDTAEVNVMVSVAREPPGPDWSPHAIQRWTPLAGWLSLQPVAGWQHHAFLTVARPSVWAAARQDIDETAPLTGATALEAFDFADWMGKRLPAQFLWQSAHATMGDALDRLWGTSRKEWAGYPEPDEDEAIALSRQTLLLDINGERDADQPAAPARRMLYGCNAGSPEIRFRTAVHEVGLLESEADRARYQR